MHVQTGIKVNAAVDVDIAPLVLALNQSEKVLTLESCQGREDEREGNGAWVAFTLADGDLLKYVEKLADRLSSRRELEFWFKVSVEWFRGSRDGLGYIRCSPNPSHLRQLAEAVADRAN